MRSYMYFGNAQFFTNACLIKQFLETVRVTSKNIHVSDSIARVFKFQNNVLA